MRPYSEACERNKGPILQVLREYFVAPGLVLEIGSGTGQHACFFAEQLPHLVWQPTEVAAALPVLGEGLAGCQATNLRPPQALEAGAAWPFAAADYVFSANTAHIMGWPQAQSMLQAAGKVLAASGRLCLYGPFNYGGRYTSPSNARFDDWLKARDPRSGIRDFEAVVDCAEGAGLELLADCPMPANNRCLLFQRLPAVL